MIGKIRHIWHIGRALFREHVEKSLGRSSQWSRVRREFLGKHPKCVACGKISLLNVHHKVPFHIDKNLELVECNLITLCMGEHECHIKIGHGGDWDRYNPNVVRDAGTIRNHPEFREKIEQRAYRTSMRVAGVLHDRGQEDVFPGEDFSL